MTGTCSRVIFVSVFLGVEIVNLKGILWFVLLSSFLPGISRWLSAAWRRGLRRSSGTRI